MISNKIPLFLIKQFKFNSVQTILFCHILRKMPELINANPTIYIPSKTSHRILTAKDEDENIEDIIDSQEVFGMFESSFSSGSTLEIYNTKKNLNPILDLIRSISDPEHPLTLEELNVTQLEYVTVDDNSDRVVIEFTPTIPHCSMATLIGLCIRVRLLRSLPERFKVDINVRKGTHQSEQAGTYIYIFLFYLLFF